MVFGLENGKNWVCFFKKGFVLNHRFPRLTRMDTDLCIATEFTEDTEKLKVMVLEDSVIFKLPMLIFYLTTLVLYRILNISQGEN